MRRLGAVFVVLFSALLAMTSASLAQTSGLRTCPNVALTAPADGATLGKEDRIGFAWGSEPRGTASRDWITVRLDGNASLDDARHAKAERGSHKAFARGRAGTYAWAVIFYDAKGAPICVSESRTYVVGEAGFVSSTSAGGPLGKYIIRLIGGGSNTFYTGPADKEWNSLNYDDSTAGLDWKARGYTGLRIYGNQRNNIIVGSNMDDEIYGGNESCDGGCSLGDNIDGGDGDDFIDGGDETCNGGCSIGDTIRGGKGKDTIRGGNETCNVGGCSAGDTIDGGDDDDTINGGDEFCGGGCSAGDTITGGDGADTLFGGNEACGGACSAGDTITGNLAGNAEDGDKDIVNGQGGNDALSGTGADVLNQ